MCCGRAKRRNRAPAVLRLCNVGSFGQTGAAIVCALPAAIALRRSLPRSRGALLRPGGVLVIASAPIEGRAERRQAHYVCCRAGEARPLRTSAGCGASHDAGRSPLGAPPWRFSAGGRASISGIASGSVQRAPRSQVVMPGGRCPGPPESAVTSRSRRTPLPAPPSGSSPEDGPSWSGDLHRLAYIRYVVNSVSRP